MLLGSDAISTAMAGVFYYLSRNPIAYKKACEEVRHTFSSLSEIRMGQKMATCVYLRACIDESLRMSPPVGGALWREVCKGGVKLGDKTIPQGYDVGVGIYAIHHNPLYYPNPFSYHPERWINGDSTTAESVELARSAFSAFSIGPVGCVGKNLAYLELMVTMARVLWALDIKDMTDTTHRTPEESYLRKYKDHSENEYRLRDRFTSWKNGPMLSFRAREQC